MMSLRRSWNGVILAAALTSTQAKQISGKSDSSTKATLFSNIATDYPNAKKGDGTAATNNLKWEIANLTWKDEDTGTQYLEITTTLTAPILEEDVIRFHVEYISSKQSNLVSNSQLNHDGFECVLTKDVSTDFWKTEVTDIYVRDDGNGNFNPVNDFSNALSNNGQDWIVFQEDAEREDDDHLCTTSSTTGIHCSKIKCVVRRALENNDPDDMQFKPDASSPNKMTFTKARSWIMLNQTTVTDTAKRKVLETLADAEITILNGSIINTAVSFATGLAALTALTLF